MGGKRVQNILKVINDRTLNKTYESNPDEFGLFDLSERVSSEYFLHYYSPKSITKLLEDFGIIHVLKVKHGFNNLYIKIDVNEYDQHSLIIFDESTGDVPIVLLRLREVYFDAVKHFVTGIKLVNIPMLMIDWITLQNPKKKFTKTYRKMPGQTYPGLRMLKQFYRLLIKIANDLSVRGLLAVPEYFHLAAIYSPIMKFYDPELQGKFESMLYDIRVIDKSKKNKRSNRRSIIECSEAIEENKLLNYISNEIEIWHPSEMIYPLEKRGIIYKYFKSNIYNELKNSYKESNRYRLLQ